MVIEKKDNRIIIELSENDDLKEIELMLNFLAFRANADRTKTNSTSNEVREDKKRIRLEDFSKSRAILKKITGALSDDVIEERKVYL